MKRVYRAGSLQEAYLLAGLLEQEGIETRLFNENAAGALGEIPFVQAYPEVWVVDDAQSARAEVLIEQYEHPPAGASPRHCPHCGERNPASFDLCWACGRPLCEG